MAKKKWPYAKNGPSYGDSRSDRDVGGGQEVRKAHLVGVRNWAIALEEQLGGR